MYRYNCKQPLMLLRLSLKTLLLLLLLVLLLLLLLLLLILLLVLILLLQIKQITALVGVLNSFLGVYIHIYTPSDPF